MDPKLVHSDRLLDGDYRAGNKKKTAGITPPPPDPAFQAICTRQFLTTSEGPLGFRRSPPALFDSADFSASLRFFRNISWSPSKAIPADLIVPVWCRNIVHYTDVASHIPELRSLEPDDQLTLLADRCIPSLFLLLLQRTLEHTTKRCIVTTGGMFLPVEADDAEELSGNAFASYALDVGKQIYRWLFEPLREAEMCPEEFTFLRLLTFFAGVPRMSARGREVVRNACLHYESLFIRFLCSKYDRRTAIERMGRILAILPLLEQATAFQNNRMVCALLFNVDEIRGTFTHQLYLGRR
ncbi:hypothetical protein M3Y99_00659200 [Aphelenchoides fujianensis]|nr:hypothetical protein M3Y99_00659200 [Aphelenchoides fujianensis]